MDKKTVFAIIVGITIILYALLVVYQTGILNVGDVFGYIYYVLIAVAVIATVWLLVGKRGKSLVPAQAEAEK